MKGRPRDWRTFLVWSLAAGAVLRLLFVGTPGFPSDVGTFQAWAERMREVGPGAFYAPDYFSDYPPAYLYVLWAVAGVLGGLPAVVAKALSIPFDLAIAIALYLVLRRVLDERAGAVAAALYLFDPALVLAGPYWGQVDAVGTLPLLLALVAAASGRFALAGALAGVAAMVKPQFGVGALAVGIAAAADLVVNRRWRPLLSAAVSGAVVVEALALPFGLDPAGLVALVGRAAGTYEYTSLYAFNPWAVVSDFWQPDDQVFLGVTYQTWGTLLFAAALVAVAWWLWSRTPRGRPWGAEPGRDLGVLLAAGAMLVLAFYFLPTRVHERYLFPAFALLAPFAATRRRELWAYLGFAAFFFFSLHYAFTRYPQNGVTAPDILESTLYTRPGVLLLAVAGMALAAWLVWRVGRAPALAPGSPLETEPVAAAPRAATGWPALPAALRLGGRPTRRDLKLALLLALLVALTRAYRVDWPRDMYFDEVYHARTAMEFLAGREPYEWTHPHLAKELMAVSILLFDDLRASPSAVTVADHLGALAVDGDRVAQADANGRIAVSTRGSDLVRGFDAGGPVRALALDGERLVYATDDRLVVASLGAGPQTTIALRSPPRSLAAAGGRVVVATADELLSYVTLDAPEARVPLADTVAVSLKPDGTGAYVASADGMVRLVSLPAGQTDRSWGIGAPVATLTVEPGASRVLVGDAAAPVIHSIDTDGGGIEHVDIANYRTAPFRGPIQALATSPRSRLSYALGPDGLAVIEPHGVSAFAVVRDAAGARFLAVDDARDAVIAAADGRAVDVSAGRVAFSWRIAGVLFGALLAFFLFLLARRLFADRRVALVLGGLVLMDGAMFAQARIGMNDVYVGAFLVAAWYFVVAALSPDARRPRLALLAAGILFGLGLAAKWVAGPAILAVGVVSLVVTARAFVDDRPGTGGALDLLALRGLNALFLAVTFIAIPLGIYLASYIPWFGLGHGIFESANGGWSLVELQRQMFQYHAGLTSPHPAGSPWWAWPLDLKPVYWEYENASATTSTYIYDAGNLVTWWAAIPAFAFVAVQAVRTRAWHLLVLGLAFATQYAEWIPVSRVLFQYHFFTALPFYLTALAAALVVWWDARGRTWPLAILVAGTLWFLWFYPWLSALPIPGDLSWAWFWLPTWQYGCQFYPSFRCQ